MSKTEIDCEKALRQIYVYLDQELSEKDRVAMQQHLHTCKSCFSRVEFEKRLKHKVGALRDEDASKSVEDRIKGLLKSF